MKIFDPKGLRFGKSGHQPDPAPTLTHHQHYEECSDGLPAHIEAKSLSSLEDGNANLARKRISRSELLCLVAVGKGRHRINPKSVVSVCDALLPLSKSSSLGVTYLHGFLFEGRRTGLPLCQSFLSPSTLLTGEALLCSAQLENFTGENVGGATAVSRAKWQKMKGRHV